MNNTAADFDRWMAENEPKAPKKPLPVSVLILIAFIGFYGVLFLLGRLVNVNFFTSQEADTLLSILPIFGLIGGYFLPIFTAMNRQHHQAMAIGIVNLFLGWTVLGWIVALTWACTAVQKQVVS